MDTRLYRILQQLEYLSMLKVGLKPNLIDLSLSNTTSWFGWIQRKCKLSERKDTIDGVINYIREGIEALDLYKDSEYFVLLKRTLERACFGESNESDSGVATLVETYSNYPDTVAKISIILKDVRIQLMKYDEEINSK